MRHRARAASKNSSEAPVWAGGGAARRVGLTPPILCHGTTRDGPRSQARSSSGARYGIISQGAVSGRLISSKICAAICSSVSGFCSRCLRKVYDLRRHLLKRLGLLLPMFAEVYAKRDVLDPMDYHSTNQPSFSSAADHSADAGISPKLSAGTVTSITERRTEPLAYVREAPTGISICAHVAYWRARSARMLG